MRLSFCPWSGGGGVRGGRHVWQRRHVWQGMGACMAGETATAVDGTASYWNAFLLNDTETVVFMVLIHTDLMAYVTGTGTREYEANGLLYILT